MAQLFQSTAYERQFKMISSADHFSLKTGANPIVNIRKSGGSFAPAAGTVVETANGWYAVNLTTADTSTLKDLAFYITGTGADDTDFCDQVIVDPATAAANVAAIKVQTDKLAFTVANQVDANVLDWKSATAPAMTGDAFARLGAPAGASVSADVAAVKADTAGIKTKTDQITFTVANKIDATIQLASDFAQGAADKVWSTAARTLTAFGFSVTVGTNNDKTGYTLSSAGVQAIWDALTSALTTVGSIGKRLTDFVTGDAFVRLGAPVGASISADIAAVKADTGPTKSDTTAIKAKTDNLPAAPAATGDAMALTSAERNATADALLDRTSGIEPSLTPRMSLRLMLSALVGKLSGAATTNVLIRDTADSKNRINATVDANGNRSAVTLDGT